MTAQPRLDFESFAARAQAVRDHPRFGVAKGIFCKDVLETWLEFPFRRTLIADTSCFAVIIAIFGMNRINPDNGASMQWIVKTLEAGRFASETRIRAYLGDLAHSGAIEILPHQADRRRRKLVPTPRLVAALQRWLAANLRAAHEIFAFATDAETIAHTPGVIERYLTGVMLRHSVDNFTIFDGFPEVEAFMNRRHGYLLLLQLAGEPGLQAEIARARVADRFGVSIAHVATLLAEAEGNGWLQRQAPSSTVTLSPDFAERLNLWVAREITLIGTWAEERFAKT
jgi:DNA-binding MarR family transcriptional regulator